MTATTYCLAGGTVMTFDTDRSVFEGGEVWIRDGKVLAVGNPGCYRPGDGDTAETVDVSGRIVIPGFINAHSHSYSSILKGTVEKEPLDIYMLGVIAAGAAMSPREIFIAAQLDAISMLRMGITSVIDHFSERPALSEDGLNAVCGGFDEIGIRATVATMFSDRPYIDTVPVDRGALPDDVIDWYAGHTPPDLDAYFSLMERAISPSDDRSDRVNVFLGVDGLQRCSEDLIQLTGEFQRQHNAGLQTHMLEARTQAAMQGDQPFVRRMLELGILNDKTSLVHFIWCSDDDIAAAREGGATVVHCPQSNTMLGAGICPVLKLREAGVPVGFGTDGSNCGPANYLESLRLGAHLMRLTDPDFEAWPNAGDILQDAYHAGSRAMGLPGEIGQLSEGARADLVVLNTEGHWHRPMNDLYRHLFYYETGQSVESVWVDGRAVIDRGRITTIDEDAIVAEAEEIADRRRAGLPAEALARIDAQYPAFRDMIVGQFSDETGLQRRVRLS